MKILNLPWVAFNQQLQKEHSATAVGHLLQQEKHGQCRPGYLLRLHSRYNKLRAEQERRELYHLAARSKGK